MRTEPHSQSLHEGTSMTWLRKVRSMPPSKKPRRFSKSRRSAARSQAGLVPADQRFLCAGACINLILALFLLVIVNGSALFVDGRDEATAKWNVATVCAGAVVLCLAIAFVDFRLWSLFTEEARKYISPAAVVSGLCGASGGILFAFVGSFLKFASLGCIDAPSSINEAPLPGDDECPGRSVFMGIFSISLSALVGVHTAVLYLAFNPELARGKLQK